MKLKSFQPPHKKHFSANQSEKENEEEKNITNVLRYLSQFGETYFDLLGLNGRVLTEFIVR